MEIISIAIAVLSFVISVFTLWITYLHRGKVVMTKPTTIFFGPTGDKDKPTVFLRMLLFSTSQKGQVIESMHVKLYRAESVQTFNIWTHGERKEFVRGSGLYVGREGVCYSHYFFLPGNEAKYEFLAGQYKLEVYASLINKKPVKMFAVELTVTEHQALKIKEGHHSLYFDWGPESGKYHSLLRLDPTELLQKLI